MGVRKWLMKQYWRTVQVRGIWNLFYGILLLAIAYYIYIPFFADMGAIGPFALAGALLVSFLIIGYLYDRVFVMWGPQQEVTLERNPYQYVPHPRDRIIWFPIYSVMLQASKDISEKLELDTDVITSTQKYFSELEKLRAERKGDLDNATQLRKAYHKEHPLDRIIDEE